MNLKRETILPALTALHKIAGKRTTQPILNCFRMEAVDGQLSIRATDHNVDATELVKCDGNLSALCVGHDKFFNVIKSSREDISIEAKDGKLVIQSNGRTELPTLPADEFPKFEFNGKAIGLNTSDLARAIKLVAWACDPARKANCEASDWIAVYVSDTEITANATDGHTVSVATIKSIASPCEFYLSSDQSGSMCDALLRDGAVFSHSENKCLIKHDHGQFSVKFMEGRKFPYSKVVESSNKECGKLPVSNLLEAAKTCKMLAPPLDDRIKISFGPKMLVSSEFPGAEYRTEIESENAEFEALVSAQKLTDCLSAFESESVSLHRWDDVDTKGVPYVKAIRVSNGDLSAAVALMRMT